ncbi:MAG TPA: hypothetical protein VF502_17655 [Stellaceae bacterium]
MTAALGILGAVLCAVSPAWGARGRHGVALGCIGLGAALAFVAAVTVLFGPLWR